MDERRRQKLIGLVETMFGLRTRSPEGDRLGPNGVPVRITNLAEEIFTPETLFHVPGRGPQAFTGLVGDYYAYHAKRVSKTQDKLDLELLDILAGDKHVAALIRYNEEPGGDPFEWLRVNLFTFNEAGDKIIEVHVFEHDQYGVDACFFEGIRRVTLIDPGVLALSQWLEGKSLSAAVRQIYATL